MPAPTSARFRAPAKSASSTCKRPSAIWPRSSIKSAPNALVLDPAGPFVMLRDTATRIQDQTRLLIKLLRSSMKTTNILTSYAVPRTGERTLHGIEEYLVAGAIVLEMIWQDNGLGRSLIVEKMRCTDVKPTQLEFDILKGQGIVIQPPA